MASFIKANTFQYFTRNPRGGAAREIPPSEINAWMSERKKRDIFPVFGHLPYTVNLAAPPGKQREFAGMVLAEDLKRVGEMGGEYIVSHPGRHEGDRQAALKRLASLVNQILDNRTKEGPVLLLETMACQGKELGSIDDLQQALDYLDWREGVGICLDSAHLFEAGWDLRTEEGCNRLVAELEEKIGLHRVKAMHLNDSLTPLGSHRDRHACIGAGELGKEGISSIVNHKFFGSLPLILETTVERYEQYGDEIARVLALVK
ncbi:MAG: deoxyribonuclease [Clostridia bacterium]|nr:deoxyribonuclease [Clostridia bacterium]